MSRHTTFDKSRHVGIGTFDQLEERLGKAGTQQLRHSTWLEFLKNKNAILIDTQDYSKTDRRLMTRDLTDIYWFWNLLTSSGGMTPNIVIAIQKEMFRDHFFFDKMEKIELTPLTPEQMIKAYKKRFNTTHPFTIDALLTIAQMSRGIFRRFLRYIKLTLDIWTKHQLQGQITSEIVKKAITHQRLAEDMELEISEVFPKNSDLRIQAIQLLIHLSKSGPQKQTQLAEELTVEPYTISRLLTKLEIHRYITRKRSGADKIVKLTNQTQPNQVK